MVKVSNDLTYNEKQLPPLLDEFRTALRDEIEVAKRNATNSAVPLRDGHQVGRLGSAFQYAFFIDSVLNTPDGAPGDLIVPGKPPFPVIIVSVEGLRIVISIESDLGKFIPAARLQTNLTILMRRLIERIENNAHNNNPAASRMLGSMSVSGEPKEADETNAQKLNENQRLSLESALGRNLTVIWGPPGTGKTHTIGTIAKSLHQLKRTALIVSHTNAAVDQAILHVAKTMQKEHLEQGAMVRVGVVQNDELLSGFPDALLKEQVEKQSRELVESRDNLISKKQELSDKVAALQQEITIIEWVETAHSNIQSLEYQLEELYELERQLDATKKALAELETKESELFKIYESASNILAIRNKLTLRCEEKSHLEELLIANDSEYQDADRFMQEQKHRLEIAQRITPLRQELATYPTAIEQTSTIESLSARMIEAIERQNELQQNYDTAKTILEEASSTNVTMRVLRRLPKPDKQQVVVLDLAKKLSLVTAEVQASEIAWEAAKSKLSRIMELDGELLQHQDIGDYAQELVRYNESQKALEKLKAKREENELTLEQIQIKIEVLISEDKQLYATFEGDVNDIHQKASSDLNELKELRSLTGTLVYKTKKSREAITLLLDQLFNSLLSWDVISYTPESFEEKLNLVREAYQKLTERYKSTDLLGLKAEVEMLETEIRRINVEISEINELLAQVERNVIMNASIIGATLTKTYLSDDIQSRKFDTVILDEASMAPIPALWAAALLSENNLVLVGDFKQLPPIVQSSKELTKKWLGRDIFEASGLKEQYEKGTPPPHFIPLTEQRRMLPEIAKVANKFYDGKLVTPSIKPNEEFLEWYNADWAYDSPVVLVDTGSLNAWVTSVVKGGSSSRLNFLSATVAVDIAEQLLRNNRPARNEGEPKRILIVAPYRAHAKLVSILLRENKQIQDDVIAGTAHSFQGSEADVVIFDLVVDEPHFRVNLFMPTLDEQLKPLLNVGLTRAKSRLLILGDFSYCKSQGKKAFLGKTLLPFLLKTFPQIDAAKLVPDGLAARAAKAQMTALGGEIEPNSDRLVVTQADFFRVLSSDLSRAENRIIIYSPFITQDRLAFLMPQLQAASLRGVSIFIITKSHAERSKSELSGIRKMETQLSELGAVVIHKMRMHEKLVFFDDNITWSGSLNPLSFSNTQEIMERRKSKAVMEDYFQTLRLQELLSVPGNPEAECPICGSNMIAAEGADQPYYWRCVNEGCYSRSIDQPYPFDGVLTCGTCNGQMDFGYWGDYPHWRCIENSRHRQKIFKSHLRLPKMADRIPKRERRKVCRLLGIEDFNDYVLSAGHKTTSKQTNIFDDLS